MPITSTFLPRLGLEVKAEQGPRTSSEQAWTLRPGRRSIGISHASNSKTMLVDGAILPGILVPRRGRTAALPEPPDVAIVADDEQGAAYITSLGSSATHIHVAGPSRVLSMMSDIRVMREASRLSDAFARLALDEKAPASLSHDMLAFLIKHEIGPVLRPLIETADLAREHNIGCIILHPAYILAAAAIADILKSDGLAYPATPSDKSHAPAAKIWRHIESRTPLKVDAPSSATSLLVRPTGARRIAREDLADRIANTVEAMGAHRLNVTEEKRHAISWKNFQLISAVFAIWRKAGVPRALALMLTPITVRALEKRLPPLIALTEGIERAVQGSAIRHVVTVQGLRMAGAFAAWGARRAGAETIDLRPNLESQSDRYKASAFTHAIVFDATQTALDRGGAIASATKSWTIGSATPETYAPQSDALIAVSQPLTVEMDRLALVAASAARSEKLTIRLHPNDGPAAGAAWQRRLPGVEISSPNAPVDFSRLKAVVSDSSNLAAEAAQSGVPVLISADPATINQAWPGCPFEPVQSLDTSPNALAKAKEAAMRYRDLVSSAPILKDVIEELTTSASR